MQNASGIIGWRVSILLNFAEVLVILTLLHAIYGAFSKTFKLGIDCGHTNRLPFESEDDI